MDVESKSLITLEVLREFLNALPTSSDQDRVVDALLSHEKHWSLIAEAHDAGVIKPLTADQVGRVGNVGHPSAALWSSAAQQSAAGSDSLHRLAVLARLISTDEAGALAHLATGKTSAVMHCAKDLGLGPGLLRDTYFSIGAPCRISEVGLALMYTRIRGEAWTKVRESIWDLGLPVVSFGTSKKSTTYTAADAAAACPQIAKALTRSGVCQRDAGALRDALEARITHMVAASEKRPRSAPEMKHVASVLAEFAAAGVFPSRRTLSVEIHVKTVEPSNVLSGIKPKASRLPFVNAFAFWKNSLIPATKDSAQGNDHGSLWTYFAAAGRLDALRQAVSAGFAIDSQGTRLRPINAALAAKKVDPDLLALLVAHGADSDPVFPASGDQSARALLSAARAMQQLTGTTHVPVPAL